MALDWSKDISFAGLKKKDKKKANDSLPSKTTMNLVRKKTRNFDLRKTIIFAVLGVLIVALVLKFGVFDFFGRVDAKKAELTSQEQVLTAAQLEIMRYSDVAKKYESYGFFNLDDKNANVDILDALALVDRKITPVARIASFDMKNNVMTLDLANISLDTIGNLTASLYEEPMVKNVAVSTASTEKDQSAVIATMKVTLTATEEK